MCIARRAGVGGGAEKRKEPLSAIAMVLQAAPGDDDLPPPGPPSMFDDSNPFFFPARGSISKTLASKAVLPAPAQHSAASTLHMLTLVC